MKLTLSLLLALTLTSSAQDALYAIVRNSTNVADVWQYDGTRPPRLPDGTSAVRCPPYVAKGWRYVAPSTWLQPDGSPAPVKEVAKADRLTLIEDTIGDLTTALNNWDTLTAAQQKAVLRRLTVILRAMLVERRELLEIKEEEPQP